MKRATKEEYLALEFSNTWADAFKLKGNERYRFRLECDMEETRYITRPRDAMMIDKAIEAALDGDEIIIVVDAFACVGGDTIAMMHAFTD